MTALDDLIETIITSTDAQVEYASSNSDYGNSYLPCVPDGMKNNNAADRATDWLALHNITLLGGADDMLDYCAQMDLIEPTAGSIWGPYSSKPFYNGEHHWELPEFFQCDSYAIEEVEVEIECSCELAHAAVEDLRVCVNLSSGGLLSYAVTDAVWFYLINIKDVHEWLQDQIDRAGE